MLIHKFFWPSDWWFVTVQQLLQKSGLIDRFIIIHVHKKRTYIKARKEIWYWKLAINCSGEKKSRCCNESSVLNTETMWKTLFICIGAQNPKKTEINSWKKKYFPFWSRKNRVASKEIPSCAPNFEKTQNSHHTRLILHNVR